MFIEWAQITSVLEKFEDLTGALIPSYFAFLLYAFLQVRNNEIIAKNEARFRIASIAGKVGVWDYDFVQEKVFVSDSWSQIIGEELHSYDAASVMDILSYIHSSYIDKSKSAVISHIEGKVPKVDIVVKMRNTQKEWVWVHFKGKIVERDEEQHPVRMSGTFTDVSTQKELELNLKEQIDANITLNEEYLTQNEELSESLESIRHMNLMLEESKERIEESDRLKSIFLANISHEIRTPLNGIVGFSQMISDPRITNEKRKSYAEIISMSSQNLLSTVSDILDISCIQSGDITLHEKKIELNKEFRSLYDEYISHADKKSIKLVLSEGKSDEFYIVIDENRLNQIMVKLLNNALKYTHQGTIEFGYVVNVETINFYVTDSGIGIYDEEQSKIFDAFRQGTVEKGGLYEGTGLGLSIAKNLVEYMGGTISIESERGVGSMFSFSLPLKENLPNNVNQLSDSDFEPYMPDNELTILVVEDDEVNFILLEEVLLQHDYKIIHAKNGKEAIDIVTQSEKIDLIFMDIKMPVMDGLEATRQIKKIKPNIPVIAQTAYVLSSDREEAKKAGCIDCLAKPIKVNEVLRLVQKYI